LEALFILNIFSQEFMKTRWFLKIRSLKKSLLKLIEYIRLKSHPWIYKYEWVRILFVITHATVANRPPCNAGILRSGIMNMVCISFFSNIIFWKCLGLFKKMSFKGTFCTKHSRLQHPSVAGWCIPRNSAAEMAFYSLRTVQADVSHSRLQPSSYPGLQITLLPCNPHLRRLY
jgi:hypothetical protein